MSDSASPVSAICNGDVTFATFIFFFNFFINNHREIIDSILTISNDDNDIHDARVGVGGSACADDADGDGSIAGVNGDGNSMDANDKVTVTSDKALEFIFLSSM